MPKHIEPTDADLIEIENELDQELDHGTFDDLIAGDTLGLTSPLSDPDLDWLFG